MTEKDDFAKLEEKIERLRERVEEVGSSIGDAVEERLKRTTVRRSRRDRVALFWGLAFIIAGFIWLGNRAHWFDIDLPFWPAALIVIGLYIIFHARRD